MVTMMIEMNMLKLHGFRKKAAEGAPPPQAKGWIDCEILKIYCENIGKYI